MNDAKLSGADLYGSVLHDADLGYADLGYVALDKARLVGAKCNVETEFPMGYVCKNNQVTNAVPSP